MVGLVTDVLACVAE
uniref:Uncharacterized protein n=1 Tax=Arundo donax TaxID=35708 RepID=A0A0A8ZLB2_ARUDO